MTPLIPRMHLFEIDDQPWFPPILRRRVQDTLRQAWLASPPILSQCSPADLAASILIRTLGPSATLFTFVDFCAGGGGPTPRIERTLNAHAAANGLPRADFVMTDLFPHVEAWERAKQSSKGENLRYVKESIDASAVDGKVLETLLQSSSSSGTAYTTGRANAVRLAEEDRGSKGVFRIFNLAFHHFPDPLAKAILRNCVETNTPFAIFELQDRTFDSLVSVFLLGIGMVLSAPYWAWRWKSPAALIFTYIIPILPFVIIFDGLVSSVRTRTPQEVAVLLRTCGAEGNEDWVIKSGRERFLWPCCYLNYVMCMKEGT